LHCLGDKPLRPRDCGNLCRRSALLARPIPAARPIFFAKVRQGKHHVYIGRIANLPHKLANSGSLSLWQTPIRPVRPGSSNNCSSSTSPRSAGSSRRCWRFQPADDVLQECFLTVAPRPTFREGSDLSRLGHGDRQVQGCWSRSANAAGHPLASRGSDRLALRRGSDGRSGRSARRFVAGSAWRSWRPVPGSARLALAAWLRRRRSPAAELDASVYVTLSRTPRCCRLHRAKI